jgi:hypothetical protein
VQSLLRVRGPRAEEQQGRECEHMWPQNRVSKLSSS